MELSPETSIGELVDLETASQLTRIPVETLRSYCQRGVIPALKTQFGGAWAIRRADLDSIPRRKVGRPCKPKPHNLPLGSTI